MGTPAFAVPSLEALAAAGHDVALVVTREDKPRGRSGTLVPPEVKRAATSLGIEVFQPRSVRDDATLARLRAVEAQAFAVVAYGRILPRALLDAAPLGAVNVHASLLPRLRGAAPIAWAIARREAESGVCIMQIDEGLDTGDVWSEQAVRIGERETAPELGARLATLGAELLVQTLPRIADGSATRRPQDHGRATLAPIIRKEDGRVAWSMAAGEIGARIRAFDPWPGCHARAAGQEIRIDAARPAPDYAAGAEPGTVLAAGRQFVVACGGGSALEILELSPAGRRRMPGRDFVNGARLRVGATLEVPAASGGE